MILCCDLLPMWNHQINLKTPVISNMAYIYIYIYNFIHTQLYTHDCHFHLHISAIMNSMRMALPINRPSFFASSKRPSLWGCDGLRTCWTCFRFSSHRNSQLKNLVNLTRYEMLRGKWLLEIGSDVRERDSCLWTPLHAASAEGHAELVEWLLKQGLSCHWSRRGSWWLFASELDKTKKYSNHPVKHQIFKHPKSRDRDRISEMLFKKPVYLSWDFNTNITEPYN